MDIQIQVRNKVAVNLTPENVIVCGNSGYVIAFNFDEEWENEVVKTARFVYRKDGKNFYEEIAFSGSSVSVPVLSGIHHVLVGVYAGNLRTTTPAFVECDKSILCGGGVHKEPTPDVYHQIIELIETGCVAGKDGTSVTVTNVMESTADGGSNVVTFSDGTTLTVKNGKTGATGAAGKDGAKGEDGADGHTPVRGVDYWTDADVEEIKAHINECVEAKLAEMPDVSEVGM